MLETKIGFGDVGYYNVAGPIILAGTVIPTREDEIMQYLTKLGLIKHVKRMYLGRLPSLKHINEIMTIVEHFIYQKLIITKIKYIHAKDVDKSSPKNILEKTMKNIINEFETEYNIICDPVCFKDRKIKINNKFIPHIPCIQTYTSFAKAYFEHQKAMRILHNKYPMYKWNKNYGRPSKEHNELIKKYGFTEYHKKYRVFYKSRQFVKEVENGSESRDGFAEKN